MKKILLILLCLFLNVNNCAPTQDGIRVKNRSNLSKLKTGMKKTNVIKIMGNKKIIGGDGFSLGFYTWRRGDGTIIKNPFKSEILKGKDKVFEVIYYYTDIKSKDDGITDDELTPLVFDDRILIGWDWRFLEETIQKYEIRDRYSLPQ